MNLTKWLDDTGKDLRIDWYIEPELAWEERTSQSDGSSSWTRRKISAPRQRHLQVALRDLFAEKSIRHLLLVDDAGSGKSVASLRIEWLLNESQTRKKILGDSLPRLVIHWSGRLPAAKISTLQRALIETLANQPSWRTGSTEISSRDQRNRASTLVEYALRERRVIVIVDAFDELTESQRQKVADWFHDTSDNVRWIITSRDDAVKEYVESDRLFDPKHFKRLRLEPLDSKLQDQYIERALGKKSEEWRTWLQGSSEEWNELLGLPNTLREIVRFVTDLGQQHPAWSSPSDLFCQFSAQMIFRELKKRKHNKAWTRLKENAHNGDLSREEGVEFIEMILGAVALEMGTREKWTVVTSKQLTQEIKSIKDRVEERFTRACTERGIPSKRIGTYWDWAYNFASRFQLHKGSTQGILNARWISFRSKRIQEMWAARYITTYASEFDLRDSSNPTECVLGHNGNPAWKNLWECAIRMPIRSDAKTHGVDAKRYLRALEVLFERPLQSNQRRPTELMWLAEEWLWGNPSLRRMLAELHSHLAAQFERLKENDDPSHKRAIDELLDPKNYVLLCTPNSTLPGDEASFEMGPDKRRRTVFVKFKTPFAIACYALTHAQMRLWDNGFEGREDRLAASRISWYDAYYFCRYLGGETLTLKDGKAYRFTFPTEAQWEYACKAGTTTAYCYGDDEEDLTQYAWYSENSDGPHEVGKKKPNAWKLYDMHGNVFEWCSDWWGPHFESFGFEWCSDWFPYFGSPQVDPIGPSTGPGRVCRGGSWDEDAENCRSASRETDDPWERYFISGFRLALSSSVIPKSPEADK